ncbi:unnamed protein product [Gadus morhua 'NCC']
MRSSSSQLLPFMVEVEVEKEVETEVVEEEDVEKLKMEVLEEEEEDDEELSMEELEEVEEETAEVQLQVFFRMGSEAETEVVTRQTLGATGQVEAVTGKDWRPWLTLTLKGFPLPPQAADALAGCHGSQRLGNVQLASYTNPAKLSPGNSN